MFAHFAEFVDAVIQHWLELKPTDTYVTSEWRPRVTLFANQAVQRLWAKLTDADKYISASIVFTNGVGTLPSGFRVVGPGGRLGINSTGTPRVHWADPGRVLADREEVGSSGNPTHYTIVGNEILFNTLASGTYKLYYKRTAPTLIDTSVGGASGLESIPSEFYTALFWGAIAYLELKNDESRTNFWQMFDAKIDEVNAGRQHGQEEVEQIAEYGINEYEMY